MDFENYSRRTLLLVTLAVDLIILAMMVMAITWATCSVIEWWQA
ncbi:hypothetical protein [Raoultella ornithinolytica]|jgi:hypothetical protein|uniref:Uncharacterized protein n=1 Tax=Raoultella ornithinolytica TaxID=54291 RepID=A0A9Q9JE44_RAOOR|nr:hypothetical protein [Raoultella ornithinolytica]UXE39591.1 hypothetical protein N2J37_07590 [Raoultella ornithinolytica]